MRSSGWRSGASSPCCVGGLSTALRAVDTLTYYWYQRAALSEGHHWTELALARAKQGGTPQEQALALSSSGTMLLWHGELAVARQRLAESVTCWRALGNVQQL